MTDPAGYDSRPWCLISDIDDTLTGDDAALNRLAETLKTQRSRLWFAVNSSRPYDSVAETLAGFPPGLVPDATITALGTEIRLDGRPLESWHARFSAWPQAQIFAILSDLGHRPHDPAFQTDLKVSFAVPQGAAQQAARVALAELPCQIIASGRDDFDVIPTGAGKGAAALHLADTLGNTRDDLVVAGDSGNDIAMFRICTRGIAVGNARAELMQALAPGTFIHTGARHAGGVLEGLVHFGVVQADPSDWQN